MISIVSKATVFAKKVLNWVQVKIEEGKKKAKSKSDWWKLTAFAFVGAVIGLVLVALIVSILLIALAFPGLVLGVPAWFAWTYLGYGAHFFPNLDPAWLNITYGQFVFFLAAICWAFRLIRGKGQTQAPQINKS